MKTNVLKAASIISASLVITSTYTLPSQTTSYLKDSLVKEKILILDYETNESSLQTGNIIGEIAKIELEKTNLYDVIDRNDALYLAQQKGIKLENCYGNLCLLDIGRMLGVDKVLGGSVKNFGNAIVCSFRLIDVKKGTNVKTQVMEFLPIKEEISRMISITIAKLFNQPIDETLVARLQKIEVIDNEINNPNTNRLRLDGPRMGGVYFMGETGKVLNMPKEKGGYGIYPLMYQFGYQFEIQYFTAGKWQALFEIVPLITGLDQSSFFPSLTIMNGLRHNINGWEIGIGPTFSIAKYAEGFYDSTNVWRLYSDWQVQHPNPNEPFPYEKKWRMDSRGDLRLVTGVVIALGKTFRSGKLNIPINLFFVPSPNGHRLGISLGYNAKNK